MISLFLAGYISRYDKTFVHEHLNNSPTQIRNGKIDALLSGCLHILLDYSADIPDYWYAVNERDNESVNDYHCSFNH